MGFLWGQQFKRLRNAVKRLDRLGINVAHIMQMNLGIDISWPNWPHDPPGEHFDAWLSRGNFLGFRGVNISSIVWGMSCRISIENKLK